MAIPNNKVEEKVKEIMGKSFPENLLFEVSETKIKFYPKDEPFRESVFLGSEVDDDDLMMVVSTIYNHYIWRKKIASEKQYTLEDMRKCFTHGATLFNPKTQSANTINDAFENFINL